MPLPIPTHLVGFLFCYPSLKNALKKTFQNLPFMEHHPNARTTNAMSPLNAQAIKDITSLAVGTVQIFTSVEI